MSISWKWSVVALLVACVDRDEPATGQARQALTESDPTALSVVLDKIDYQPGETATITGAGWHPNETITLQVTHVSGLAEPGNGHLPWTVTTDDDGAFVTSWYVDPDDSFGATFRLEVSCPDGYTSTQLFTDGLGATQVVNHTDAGFYSSFGQHDAANKSYKVGNSSGEVRDYFVFDVPGAAAFTTAAQLVAKNGGCGKQGGIGFDVLRLYDVTTAPALLSATQTNRIDIFGDLGAGQEVATALSLSGLGINAPTITVNLNANGLAAIKKAAGGKVAFGGKFFDLTTGSVFNNTECDTSPGAVQLVLTIDNQAPVARCKDVTTCATAGRCDAPASIDDGSSDPDGDTLTLTQTPVAPYGLGARVVQLTVTDPKGASSSCIGTVTVRDCEAPTVSCPGPVDAECTGARVAVLTPPPATATDTCSAPTTTLPLAGTFPLGTTAVPYTATDPAGNTASCSTTVTVHDTHAPSIQCPAPATVECTANDSAPATLGVAQAADQCTGVTIASDAKASYGFGTTPVTFRATDEVGNVAACATSVTVVDTTPPTIACPAPRTAECTGNHSATIDLGDATASDACTTAQASHVAAASYPLGTTPVAYSATDGHGLAASCTTTATVVDTTAPAIACPAPVTAECTGNGAAAVDPGHASAADVCGGVTLADAPAGTFPLGTTATTFTATDEAGLTAACTSAVTVVDTTPPAISCPAPVTAECTGDHAAVVVPGHATAADACGGVTVTDAPAASFPIGTTPTTFSAVDAAGLVASCASEVTVVDTTPPAITCPAPVTAECTNGGALVDPGHAFAADACGTVAVQDAAPGMYPLGITPTLFAALDDAGLSAACASSVTVVDTQPPAIACPTAVTAECTGNHAATVDPGHAVATDACGAVAISDAPTGSFPVGTTATTFSATDGAGHDASCTSQVTVVDTTAPTITCPAPVTAECTGDDAATVDPGQATAADTCGDVTIANAASGTFPLGTTATQFSVTDEAGLTAACSSSVTVVDTTPPAIDCPAPIVVECEAAGTATVDLPAAVVTDACTTATGDDPDALPYGMGTTNVTYNAADAHGNATSCMTTVTVVDTKGPKFSNVPAAIEAELAGPNGTAVSVPLPAAADACDGALAVTSDAPAVFPFGVTTVTFTAIDSSGNTAQAQTTVTIVDTRPPTWSNVPAPIVVQQTSPQGATVTMPMPTAVDVYDGPVPVTSDAPAMFPPGQTKVTFTATDTHGNKSTTWSTVTVVDTKAPAITSLYATPNTLYHIDYHWEPITITAVATDIADAHPDCQIASVTYNEKKNSCGHHHDDDDWKLTGPLSLSVRSEHGQQGSGRVYTIVVRCTDDHGNSAQKATTVTVLKKKK